MVFTEYVGKEKIELLYFMSTEDEDERSAIDLEVEHLKQFMVDAEEAGGARDQFGMPLRSNNGVVVTGVYQEQVHESSPIISVSKRIANRFFDFAREYRYNEYGIFGRSCKDWRASIILNGYKDGEGYGTHRDFSDISIIWFPRQGEYEGGQVILEDFNLQVAVHSFHGIIFPSFYRHKVLPIVAKSDDFERYSVSVFVETNG